MGQPIWPQKAPGSYQVTFDFRKRMYLKRFSGNDFDWLGLGHVPIPGLITATPLSEGSSQTRDAGLESWYVYKEGKNPLEVQARVCASEKVKEGC